MSGDGFDIAQLRQTFLVEAAELVETFEAGILALEKSPNDLERVHEIFRAAHSLKGGAATVGFADLVEVTHVLESLLDRWRSGTIAVGRSHFDALLRAADVLNDSVGDGQIKDQVAARAVREEIAALLGANAAGPAPATTPAPAALGSLAIRFAPRASAFDCGGDPLLVLRELASLASSLTTELDAGALPPAAEVVPDRCYLAWKLVFEPSPGVDRARIDDCFAFCDADVEIADVTAEDEESAEIEKVAAPAGPTSHAESTIRVATEKVDALVDLVGELVISHSVMRELVRSGGPDLAAMQEAVLKTERHLRELQERVMAVRMVPVSALYARVPRMVRELAKRLGKDVHLETEGGETELDKVLVERLIDPVFHLVRNALDHGIEPASDRVAAGKPARGTVRMSAHARAGSVYLEVSDDGGGLRRERILEVARSRGMQVDSDPSDAEVYALIAAPGFSTAETVTDVSGRGVGLDVVRRNIESMGGDLHIESERGRGTRFRLRLPLTLTIMDGLQVKAGGQTCVMPMVDVAFSIRVDPRRVRSLAGIGNVLDLDAETLPLLSLESLLHTADSGTGGLAVVVQAGSARYALRVDALLGQAQVVVKSIETHFRRVPGMIGATILGDGNVALILDGQGIASVAGLTRSMS